MLQQGYAVEEFSVKVPRHVERGVAVVEELHVVYEVERFVLHDVRQVGGRHYEQREWHFVPLHPALHRHVELSPAVEPEALVDAGLGEVVVVVAAEHALHAHGVGEGEHWRVVVHLQASLLGVDVCLAWGVTYLEARLRSAELAGGGDRVVGVVEQHGGEAELAAGFVLLGLEADGCLQSPVLFVLEEQLLAVVEHHLVHLGPLQRGEHVVLVGGHELVRRRAHVIRRREGKRALGVFPGHVVFPVERVDELPLVIVLPAAPAPGVVAGEEEVGVEVGCGLCA